MTGAAAENEPRALECDIVLRGGVTSGIVYPGAISEIARTYRLRSIGGTSVGAIAAAAAAAMEYGRLNGNKRAVKQMAGISSELSAEVTPGISRLDSLLVPAREFRGLFKLLRASLRQGGKKGMGRARRLSAWRALGGRLLVITIAASTVAIASMIFDPSGQLWQRIAHALFAGLVLAILVGAFMLRESVLKPIRAVRENGFGLCSGLGLIDGQPGVIDWAHEKVQQLAGTSEVLTFGDLWRADVKDAKGRSIDLKMITTDLTRGRMVQLPFFPAEDELYADKKDLARVLPALVVEKMDKAGRVLTSDAKAAVAAMDRAERDFIRLPKAEDLPVLFAMRMSMSFPLLFTAVRLYLLRRPGGDDPARLQELWFSDGGITSNFPVHLFDAPLPSRPTFCFNLVSHDEEIEEIEAPDDRGASRPAAAARKRHVYMPLTNRGRINLLSSFGSGKDGSDVVGFAGRIFHTARQWNDHQALSAPGYRDRIVHIQLFDGEGGLNFDMSRAMVRSLHIRGRLAGRAIACRFRPGQTADPFASGGRLELGWDNHRFVRFRSYLAGLEIAADRFADGWKPEMRTLAAKATKSAQPSPFVGYRFESLAQRDAVMAVADALAKIGETAQAQGPTEVAGHLSPRPKPVLRLRPAIDSDPEAEQL